MTGHLRDRVPDVVVVSDGVERLALDPGRPPRRQAHLQQRRIEERFLGRRVQFEERRQPSPHCGQHLGVRAADLLQDREQPSLLVMVVKDQLGDIHRPILSESGFPASARDRARCASR